MGKSTFVDLMDNIPCFLSSLGFAGEPMAT